MRCDAAVERIPNFLCCCLCSGSRGRRDPRRVAVVSLTVPVGLWSNTAIPVLLNLPGAALASH